MSGHLDQLTASYADFKLSQTVFLAAVSLRVAVVSGMYNVWPLAANFGTNEYAGTPCRAALAASCTAPFVPTVCQ